MTDAELAALLRPHVARIVALAAARAAPPATFSDAHRPTTRRPVADIVAAIMSDLGDPDAPDPDDRRAPPPITITLPPQEPPVVNVTVAPAEAPVVNVTVPRQEPPVVNVTVPPPAPLPAPVVNVTVPPAEPPTVNVTVPPLAPPVVNVAAPAPPPAPVVNVTVPPSEPRTVRKTATRGPDGAWAIEEVTG